MQDDTAPHPLVGPNASDIPPSATLGLETAQRIWHLTDQEFADIVYGPEPDDSLPTPPILPLTPIEEQAHENDVARAMAWLKDEMNAAIP